MSGIPFWKMSGSGNDFILIDNRRGKADAFPPAELARELCTRRFSVGADGLILIEKSDRADFAWQFLNADGSTAAMCGNGGRCAARFAYLKGIATDRMRFETGAGIVQAEVRGTRVKLQLPLPYDYRREVAIKIKRKKFAPGYVVTGVPHAVLAWSDLEKAPVRELGRQIRNHAAFSPDGTNVNFFRVEGARRLSIRTYERGVEAETMACGTGSVAAALIAVTEGLVKSPVRIGTRGGEELTVYLRRRAGQVREVYLEGEARVAYQGKTAVEPLEGPKPG